MDSCSDEYTVTVVSHIEDVETMTMSVFDTDTIEMLKISLFNRTGVPVHLQSLRLGEGMHVLHDSDVIGTLGLRRDSGARVELFSRA
jgi:hypothetical protein